MRRFLAILSAVAVLASVACGEDDTATGGEDAADTTITVFAAASLTDAFSDMAGSFESANPGVSVELNFAGSSSLREQVLAGAPADVFASANESNMEQLVEAGEVDDPTIFATNWLQIVVPTGNPAGVTGLGDFGDRDLLIGMCAEEVPCGEFGRRALGAAGVTPSLDTNEPDVRALLTKVEAGELDAGLVYVTDVVSAGEDVEGVDLPAEADVIAEYPIGTVASSPTPDVAAGFVSFVLSTEGRALLEEHGFGLP
jgi:molybdate transport system substrate-binding protein